MAKSLQNSEKKALLSLYISKAIENFPYPDEAFFKENMAVLRVKPSSAQLNGLWQMALNAEDVDEMCKELIRKVSKATLPEWRFGVINTFERPVPRKPIELWKFLAQSLIQIRNGTGYFMERWLDSHKDTINNILQEKNYAPLGDITLSESQHLELARSFIHRFVSKIIVERRMREG